MRLDTGMPSVDLTRALVPSGAFFSSTSTWILLFRACLGVPTRDRPLGSRSGLIRAA